MLLEGDDDKQFCDDEFSREQVDKKNFTKGRRRKERSKKEAACAPTFEREKIFMIQASE